ncbi:MAG: hypothetical protein GY860_14325 [Desulfobacteraceae bacterium]|nr:hypothetical protein [Desulfobacteraceae bacterium]
MKKRVILFVVGLTILGLSGCNSIYYSSPGPVTGPAPGDSNENRVVTFIVKGKGVEPEAALTKGQARLMAERAAVSDGYRQFVEKVRGVYVEAFSKGGYGKIDQDFIATSTRSLLRGVEIKEITHGDYGIATAVMELRINFTRSKMIWWPEGLGKNLQYTYTANKNAGYGR